MTGYLEGYRAGEEQREKRIKRIALIVLLALVLGGTLYFLFRNYRETQQVKLFFELLQKKDYTAAYRLWGCTDSTPCPNYPMSAFLRDWGPQSPHADASALKIVKTRGCATGVIFETTSSSGQSDDLWVDRKTKYLGYAPWPVCNPRLPKS